MKSYTDIEQSKGLAEILPIESADMWWSKNFIYYNPTAVIGISAEYSNVYTYKFGEDDIPCWSLAALLELIGVECRMEKTPLDQSGEFTYSFVDDYYDIRTFEEGNAVDAAVEMILKLKGRNLL